VKRKSLKTVLLDVEGIHIVGQLYLPDGEPPFPAVCICHGIPSGKPRDPADGGYPALAERICNEGFAVLIFSFRGCGESGGNLDLYGWTRDLAAAIDYLSGLAGIKPRHIALLGFSGGAAVSIYTAAQKDNVSYVISCASPAEFDFFQQADSPQQVIDHFRSIGVIRDEDFPCSVEEWFGNLELITPFKYVDLVSPRPLLIVHGLKDDMVDISHAYRLYSRACEPKRLAIIENAGHRLRLSEDAMSVVVDWLRFMYQKPATETEWIDAELEAGL
jgi:dipeptidyl aminopeptidase/acylaminoacyl peptidase